MSWWTVLGTVFISNIIIRTIFTLLPWQPQFSKICLSCSTKKNKADCSAQKNSNSFSIGFGHRPGFVQSHHRPSWTCWNHLFWINDNQRWAFFTLFNIKHDWSIFYFLIFFFLRLAGLIRYKRLIRLNYKSGVILY